MRQFIHKICAALLALSASSAGAAGLSDAAIARALALANQHPWSAQDQRRRDASASSPEYSPEIRSTVLSGKKSGSKALPANASAELGVQTVSIEIDERKNQTTGSRVRVYQFDHGTQMARRLDMDLSTGQVQRETAVHSVHLPLSQAEVDFAKTTLERSGLLERLRDEQRQRGRVAFASLNELSIKAIVFEPIDDRHVCYRERCVLLSLFDDTQTVFATEPVVHFASGEVRDIGDW